jgi:hypothetical protein
MKEFLVRLALAAALAALALTLSSRAQQAEDSARPNPKQHKPEAGQPSPEQSGDGMPSADDLKTQDALAFTGRLVKEKGRILLKDPVTKVNYRLDVQSKAKAYVGKQVKVIGKLYLNSNTIQIDSIEPTL